MESLLAHLARQASGAGSASRGSTGRPQPELGEQLDVNEVPTLLLLKDGRTVARIEGRASAPEIDRMLEPHLAATSTPA